MMSRLNYINAASVEDAVKEMEKEGVRLIAGGTDILGTVYSRIHSAPVSALVNIKKLGLDYIREENGGLVIGAAAKLSEIADSALVRGKWKLLADAARTVASPQIRHMATIGGNICQEPRCWYYRYEDNKFDCLRKGGVWCPALTGNNIYHSVFGAVRVRDTGCRTGCPNDTEIARYMELIRRGDIDGAARILFSVNPLAAVTGRICPHTCRDGCGRAPYDEAVAIDHVERFLGDYILDHADTFYTAPEQEKDKKVAVVGAGPAGLTAAWFLRRQGYAVTVFDKRAEAGGMLRYSIPAYRLPRSIVKRIITALKKIGVVFVLGDDCDAARGVKDYAKDHDAVFVGIGAQDSLAGGTEGEEQAITGLRFLHQVSEKKIAPGEGLGHVLVIGGGDVAMDAAVSAKRLGAKSVDIVYRRTKELMPAHEWELAQALEEGVGLQTSLAPLKVISEGGKVAGLKAAATRPGKDRASKVEIDLADTKVLKADTVIFALGQKIDASFHEGFLETESNGRIKTDGGSFATSVRCVFAGGDVVNGPTTVVEAIAQGRKAASGITVYLGDAPIPTFAETTADETDRRAYATAGGRALCFDDTALTESGAVKSTLPPVSARTLYDEDLPDGIDTTPLRTEAQRCLNCGCVAVNASDMATALLALGATIKTTKRTIPADEFFAAGVRRTTVLEKDELVTRIDCPAPAGEFFMEYRKFRPRKSIDFPVLSVAVNIVRNGKTIKNARIALGAMGALPMRAAGAEGFLEGKPIDEQTAAKAAELALAEAKELAENGYKIQIARAYIKRSILAAVR
jgi:NADPH-dependent glutamate synthase beta subunit-like oxidoreductase/CO/xanthine dehydrogenase FAD-binding subunit